MPYGQDAKLAVAFQNSRDTAASTSSLYLVPFLSESVEPQLPELLSENMEGRYDEGDDYGGARQVAGTIVSESQPITLGVFLTALMGEPTSVQSGNIYTHTFRPRTSDFSPRDTNIPMTVHKNLADGGQVPVYRDLVAVRGEFACRNGEFVRMTLDFAGGVVGSKTTSISLSDAVGRKWTWDATSVQIGGSASTEFDELTLTIDEQASPRWTLRDSKDPDRVKRDGRRQIRVSGTVKFTDQTEYDIFIARTNQVLDVTFTGPTEIQSGYFDTFRFVAPSFKYLTYPLGFEDASEKIVSFEGKAEYNTGSGTAVEVTVINTLAAYR